MAMKPVNSSPPPIILSHNLVTEYTEFYGQEIHCDFKIVSSIKQTPLLCTFAHLWARLYSFTEFQI